MLINAAFLQHCFNKWCSQGKCSEWGHTGCSTCSKIQPLVRLVDQLLLGLQIGSIGGDSMLLDTASSPGGSPVAVADSDELASRSSVGGPEGDQEPVADTDPLAVI